MSNARNLADLGTTAPLDLVLKDGDPVAVSTEYLVVAGGGGGASALVLELVQ